MKKKPDYLLFVTFVFLLLIGIAFVYSTTAMYSERGVITSYYFLIKHIAAILIGSIFFIAGYFITPDFFIKHYKKLLLFTILSLIIVLIPGIGKKVGGARRWIPLIYFNFQPSELAKLAVILYLAVIMKLKQKKIKMFYSSVLAPFFIVMLIIFLIFLQPDISTSAVIILITFSIFFYSRIPVLHLLMLVILMIPGLILIVQTKAYVLKRLSFINPYLDPYGKGYHLIQSFKAFKNGGFFGLGPGNSLQKIYNLPDSHNDFIFSIIVEEIGLIGGIIIMGLFLFVLYRGLKIANNNKDLQYKYLSFGITISIVLQAFTHFFVTMGYLPTTGLTLPFISYGGTSIILNMFLMGLLLNLSKSEN